MADLHFQCNACRKGIALDEGYAGSEVECPHCGAAVTMPPAALRWKCLGCGRDLAAPEDMAGKTVQCMECCRSVAVPAQRLTLKPREEPIRRCPCCGAKLQQDAVICVACGLNLKTGERLNAADAPKPARRSRRGPAVAVGVLVAAFAVWMALWHWRPPASNRAIAPPKPGTCADVSEQQTEPAEQKTALPQATPPHSPPQHDTTPHSANTPAPLPDLPAAHAPAPPFVVGPAITWDRPGGGEPTQEDRKKYLDLLIPLLDICHKIETGCLTGMTYAAFSNLFTAERSEYARITNALAGARTAVGRGTDGRDDAERLKDIDFCMACIDMIWKRKLAAKNPASDIMNARDLGKFVNAVTNDRMYQSTLEWVYTENALRLLIEQLPSLTSEMRRDIGRRYQP